jgi:hypothetical protein
MSHVAFRVPSKGFLPPVSPRPHKEIDGAYPEPLLITLSKFPVNDPPPPSSLSVSLWIELPVSRGLPAWQEMYEQRITIIYKIVARSPKKQSLREGHSFREFRALIYPLND